MDSRRRIRALIVSATLVACVLPALSSLPAAAADTVGWQELQLLPSSRTPVWGGSISAAPDRSAATGWMAGPMGAAYNTLETLLPGLGWRGPADAPSRGGPRVASWNSSTAIALWGVWNVSVSPALVASMFRAGQGWGAPTIVQPQCDASCFQYDVAVDPSGNATAVWVQSPINEGGNIFVSHFARDTGWGTPIKLSDNPRFASWPNLGVTPDGRALVLWEQRTFPNGTDEAFFATYSPGTGWSRPARAGVPSHFVQFPSAAVDAWGNAVAVWHDGAYDIICASYNDSTGNWTSAPIGYSTVGFLQEAKVAMAPDGHAVAMWIQPNGSSNDTHAVLYDPATGWGSDTVVGTASGERPAFSPAMSSGGRAFVAFNSTTETTSRLVTNRFEPGSGWVGPEVLMTDARAILGPIATSQSRWGDVFVAFAFNGANESGWAVAQYVAPDYPGPALDLDHSPSSSQNTSAVTVAGSTDPDASVKVNGEAAPVDGAGAFEWSSNFSDGTHVVGVEASDGTGNSTVTFFEVTIDTQPPHVRIISPANGSTLDDAIVPVSGTAELGSTVVVDGQVVGLVPYGSPYGIFRLNLTRTNGTFTLTAAATDAAGNINVSSATFTVAIPGPPAQNTTTNQPPNTNNGTNASAFLGGASWVWVGVGLLAVAVACAGAWLWWRARRPAREPPDALEGPLGPDGQP